MKEIPATYLVLCNMAHYGDEYRRAVEKAYTYYKEHPEEFRKSYMTERTRQFGRWSFSAVGTPDDFMIYQISGGCYPWIT